MDSCLALPCNAGSVLIVPCRLEDAETPTVQFAIHETQCAVVSRASIDRHRQRPRKRHRRKRKPCCGNLQRFSSPRSKPQMLLLPLGNDGGSSITATAGTTRKTQRQRLLPPTPPATTKRKPERLLVFHLLSQQQQQQHPSKRHRHPRSPVLGNTGRDPRRRSFRCTGRSSSCLVVIEAVVVDVLFPATRAGVTEEIVRWWWWCCYHCHCCCCYNVLLPVLEGPLLLLLLLSFVPVAFSSGFVRRSDNGNRCCWDLPRKSRTA